MKAIWINGAFGAGKTTVAEGLTDALPSRLFDPEVIGSLMAHLSEPNPTEDVQDMQLRPRRSGGGGWIESSAARGLPARPASVGRSPTPGGRLQAPSPRSSACLIGSS